MPHAPLALVLACSLLAAAAAPARRPPPLVGRQLPTGDQPKALTNTDLKKGSVGGRMRTDRSPGEGLDFRRLFGVVTGPQLQLVGPQYFASIAALDELTSLLGVDLVLPLFAGSTGASSGGFDNPAAVGTADSSEEVRDLIV